VGKDASTGSYAGVKITGSKYGRDAGYGTRGSPNRTYSATGESATSATKEAYAFTYYAFIGATLASGFYAAFDTTSVSSPVPLTLVAFS